MKKRILLLCLLMLAGSAMMACSQEAPPATTETEAPEAATQAELVLTLDELSTYDGKDGRPAYIAVDGVIYDVSPVPQWKNGEHNGNKAGIDATDIIKNGSPHGVKVLDKLQKIGTLKTSE